MPSARTMVRRVGGISIAAGLAVAAGVAGVRASPTPPAAATTTSRAGTSTASPLTLPSTSGATSSASGPGITEVGIRVMAQLDSSGGLEVVEQIRLANPVTELSLEAPNAPASAGDVSKVRALVGDLQAQTPDGPQQTPAKIPGTLTLSAASAQVALRYRLTNATVRSEPAPIGRVLALLTPLAKPTDAATPVVVSVMGSQVLNIVCPELPVVSRVCGSQTGGVWGAGPVARNQAAFVIQADLPTPGGP